MNITINLLEVASELAHDSTVNEVLNPLSDLQLINEDDMWKTDENENTIYKEEVQDIFNKWYDFYYDKLLNFKI
jgi:hypothetical protein